jgi:hypothetical protein
MTTVPQTSLLARRRGVHPLNGGGVAPFSPQTASFCAVPASGEKVAEGRMRGQANGTPTLIPGPSRTTTS